jgi:Rieske Fe-S protein
MTVSRREFVCRAGSALAAASPLAILGGCAAATAYRVTPPSDGQIRLDLSTIPELQVEAGTVMLQIGADDAPVFIVRYNVLQYFALSAICTHRGCTVEEKGSRFECPCHGSTFSRAGDVLRGPADQPLRRYPARLESNGRTLVIDYRPGAP